MVLYFTTITSVPTSMILILLLLQPSPHCQMHLTHSSSRTKLDQTAPIFTDFLYLLVDCTQESTEQYFTNFSRLVLLVTHNDFICHYKPRYLLGSKVSTGRITYLLQTQNPLLLLYQTDHLTLSHWYFLYIPTEPLPVSLRQHSVS